jgi:hypothetical protein
VLLANPVVLLVGEHAADRLRTPSSK